jgi:hypothetical protein
VIALDPGTITTIQGVGFLDSGIRFISHPSKVLDAKERSTRRETIKTYKIQWNHHMEEEATWETESYLQHNFPDFLQANLQT